MKDGIKVVLEFCILGGIGYLIYRIIKLDKKVDKNADKLCIIQDAEQTTALMKH